METFKWPTGIAFDDMQVYAADHPQREPTEVWFADNIRDLISAARANNKNSLEVLIWALKGLRGGWGLFWAIEGVLGLDTCRAIGERVCQEEGFTLEEAVRLCEQHGVSVADIENPANWICY